MDEALAARKQPRKVIVSPPSTVEADEELLVVSFDGSASVKRNIGAFSAVIWKLPEWSIITAASGYLPEITVNEAEYQGLLLGLDLLPTLDRGWIVICGDSNLIIRQMRGEIDCRAPKLQLLRLKALDRLKSWPKHDLLHVKREWNQSADKLANAALKEEAGTSVTSEADRQDLITLNRLDEILQPKIEAPVCMAIATRAASRRRRARPETLQESVVQRVRIRRVLQAQDEEQWIVHLKAYLQGDVTSLSAEEAKSCAKIAAENDLDESGLLLYCSTGTKLDVDRARSCGWSSRRRFSRTSSTITMPAWKAGIRGSGGRSRGSGSISTGAVCFGVSRNMWVNAWTVKLGKGAPFFKESRPGTFKPRTYSR
jgi:ribonuclease HI